MTHLLLRQGIVTGGAPWTGVHHNWLRSQRFSRPALQLTYDAALAALAAAEHRRDRLDEAINDTAAACQRRVKSDPQASEPARRHGVNFRAS